MPRETDWPHNKHMDVILRDKSTRHNFLRFLRFPGFLCFLRFLRFATSTTTSVVLPLFDLIRLHPKSIFPFDVEDMSVWILRDWSRTRVSWPRIWPGHDNRPYCDRECSSTCKWSTAVSVCSNDSPTYNHVCFGCIPTTHEDPLEP